MTAAGTPRGQGKPGRVRQKPRSTIPVRIRAPGPTN